MQSHDKPTGETPPLPPSVPLVQWFANADWHTSHDWQDPNSPVSGWVEECRAHPGIENRKTIGNLLYRCVWSIGPPAPTVGIDMAKEGAKDFTPEPPVNTLAPTPTISALILRGVSELLTDSGLQLKADIIGHRATPAFAPGGGPVPAGGLEDEAKPVESMVPPRYLPMGSNRKMVAVDKWVSSGELMKDGAGPRYVPVIYPPYPPEVVKCVEERSEGIHTLCILEHGATIPTTWRVTFPTKKLPARC